MNTIDEKTFKQGVDEFIGCAPEGGWSDYWAMQQDWEFYKDSLCRDGVITQKQADSWSNPCTPETFARWQKRNGLVGRGYESKKSEGANTPPTKEEIKSVVDGLKKDKALSRRYSIDDSALYGAIDPDWSPSISLTDKKTGKKYASILFDGDGKVRINGFLYSPFEGDSSDIDWILEILRTKKPAESKKSEGDDDKVVPDENDFEKCPYCGSHNTDIHYEVDLAIPADVLAYATCKDCGKEYHGQFVFTGAYYGKDEHDYDPIDTCPFCGSKEHTETVQFDGGGYVDQDFKCKSCGGTWYNSFVWSDTQSAFESHTHKSAAKKSNVQEKGNKDIYTLDLTRIDGDGNEEGLDDMQAAQSFYDEDGAIKAAKELADSYKDDDDVVLVTVMAGEQEKPNGDIVGEPFDIFTASSSDSETTAKYREEAGYTKTDGLDYYAKGGKSEANQPKEYSVHSWTDRDVQHSEDGTPEEWRCKRCGGMNGGEDGEPFGYYVRDSKGKIVISPLCSDCAGDACDILNATHGNVRKAVGLGESHKKSEDTYDRPVTLYASTRYDDAEEAQKFLDSISGGEVKVSKERNGDTLYVSIEGADDAIDTFLAVYKDNYDTLEKDCDADVNGWTDPVDLKYYTVQGRKELTGESHKKSEGIGDRIKMGIDYNMFMRMCGSAAYLDDNEDYWDALWEYYSEMGEVEDALEFFDNLFQYTAWCDADELYDDYLDDKFKDESKSKEECIQAAIDDGDLDAYKHEKGNYLVIL